MSRMRTTHWYVVLSPSKVCLLAAYSEDDDEHDHDQGEQEPGHSASSVGGWFSSAQSGIGGMGQSGGRHAPAFDSIHASYDWPRGGRFTRSTS
jgi:hypothetical protein